MELRLILATFCLLGFVNSVPLSWESGSCAQQCSNRWVNLNYQIGKTYVYNYDSNTRLNFQHEEGSEIRITAVVDVSVVSQCDFALKLRNVRVIGPVDEVQYQTILEQYPLSFSYDDGRVEHVCPSQEDRPWAINVKKAIVSSLQMSMKNLHDSYSTQETDILGNCQTNYQVVSNSWQGIVIRKQKDIRSCGKRQQAIVSFFPRNFFSEESSVRNIPIFADDYGCEYNLKSGIIRSSKCIENNVLVPLAFTSSAPTVKTVSNIVFQQEINRLLVQAPVYTVKHNLLYAPVPEEKKEDASQTTEILRGLCSEISDEIKSTTPEKFEELVSSIRELSYESASRIYQSVQQKQLCPSKKLEDIFNDALIMAASEASIRLISENVWQKETNTLQSTYFSMMLAFANQPTPGAVKSAVQMLEKQNVHRQLVLGVSALIHNFCNDEKQNCKQNADVQRALNFLKNRLNQCKPKSSEDESEIIVSLKAIRNIGHTGEAQNTVMQCATQSSINNAIRIAAIEALGFDSCNDQVNQLLMDQLMKEKSTEIRIIAYRALSKCPKAENVKKIIEMLQKEESKQVGSFIVSHMVNVRNSNNPVNAKYRDLLMKETKIPENRFPQDFQKYSRNYQLSHFFQQWGFGGVLRADVIFENEAIPTSIRSKLSLPMYERNLELVEVGLRQKGLQRNLQSLWQQQNFGKSLPEVFQNAMNKAKQIFTAQSHEQRPRMRRAFGYLMSQKDAEASMFIRIDGKDLCYVNEKDVQSFSGRDMKQMMNKIEQHLKNFMNNPNTDRAYSVTPIDTKLQMPTSSGMQVELQLKQTVVVATKIQDGTIIPSAAMKTEGAVKFGTKSPKTGYKWVGNAYSAPKVQVKWDKDAKNVRVLLVSMPQDEIVVAHIKSSVKAIENEQERQLKNSPQMRQMSGCTKTLTKATGIELCSKMDIPSKLLEVQNLITAQWNMKYTVKKSDREMKGYEFTFGMPSSSEREVFSYKIGFNTPQSRVNREMSAKVQVSSKREGSRGIKMQLKSPWKTAEASADYKYQPNEVSFSSMVVVDKSKKLNVEIGVQQQSSNKKYEMRPRVMIQYDGKEQVNLKGTINYETARKSQMQIDLRSSNNKQIVKGTIVKDGSWKSNMRLSIDCSANVANNPMRVFGTVDKSQNAISSDLRVDYQMKGQKQHAKFTSKLQNLGTKSLKKMNSFVEITFSQFPEKNVHFNWNHLNKPFEHFENEVVVIYSNQFQDPKKKVSFLQVSKLNKQQGRKGSSSEHVLNVYLGPWNRDYELQGKTNFETGDLPKYRIEINGREKKQNQNFKSAFEFLYMSRTPLKVSIDAQLQTPQMNLRYSDKLEESGRNNYIGNCKLQYNKKQVNINYSFKVKVDQTGKSHQFDLDVKLPNSRHPTQHQGLLRMSPRDFELRSKLAHQGSTVYECHSLLSKSGKSKIYLDTPMFNGKIEGNPYAYNTLSSIEFTGKTIPLRHASDLNIQPDSLSFNTKTNYNGKQVWLNSQLGKSASKIVFDAQPLSAKLDWNSVSHPMIGNLEIRSKNYPSSHKTTVTGTPDKWQLTSKTQYQGKDLAKINALYSRSAKSNLNIVTPHFTGNTDAILYGQQKTVSLEVRGHQQPFFHKSELSLTPRSIRIDSNTEHHNLPVLSLKSLMNKNAPSSIDLKTKNIVANIIADPRPNTKSVTIKVEHQPSQFKHISEVQCNPQQYTLRTKSVQRGQRLLDGNFEISPFAHRTAKLSLESEPLSFQHSADLSWTPRQQLVIDSLTTHRGQPISVNSILSKVGKSHLKVSTRPYDVAFELHPFASSQSAKLVVKGNNNPISHVTEVAYQPNRQTTITSRTETKSGNVHHIDGRLSQYDRSHLKYSSQAMNTILAVNPHSAIKQAEFELSRSIGTPTFHSTKLTYEPSRQMTLLSKTDLHNRQILNLDSKISRLQPSYLKIQSQPCDGSLEIDPHSYTPTAKLVIKGRQVPITHSTQVIYTPKQSVKIVSTTEKSGRNLLSLNSLLSRVGQSEVLVNAAPCRTTLKVNPYARTKQLSFDLYRQQNQLHHNTELSLVPRSSLTLKSVTKQSNMPLLNLNTHLNADGESHVEFANSDCNARLALNPFAATRTGKFQYSSKNYEHLTDARVQSHQITLNSNTQRHGAQVLKIESVLSARKPSQVDIAHQRWAANLNVNPYGQNKYINVQLKEHQIPMLHSSSFAMEPSKITIQSNTQHTGRTLLNVDSLLSRSQRSHLNIQHPMLNTECDITPNAKSGQLKIRLPQSAFEHNTEWDLQPAGTYNVNTQTVQRRRTLFGLKSNINQQLANVNVNCPYFETQAEYHPIARQVKINYLARHSNNRRILMAISANELPKNAVSIELSLDADKNPEDKISLRISADKERYSSSSILNIEGDFKGNKLECPLKMGDDILRGPHELNCQVRSEQNIYQVVFHHSAQDGKVNCNFKYNKNGKQELNVVNNFVFEQNSNELKLTESFKIQSVSQSLDGFEFGGEYQQQFSYGDNQVKASVNAKLPGDSPYSAQFQLIQQGNTYTLNAQCSTPLYDFRNQEINVKCELDRYNGAIEGSITTSSDKKIEINGNYKYDSKEASASLQTKSDYDSLVPRLNIEASVKNNEEKQALFNAEVNSEKFLEILGTVNFKSVNDFTGQAVVDSKWSPRLAVTSRGNQDSANTDYEVDVKKEAETLMTTKFKGGKNRSGFQYKGLMDVSGSNVAQLDVNYDDSPMGPSYTAAYKGPLTPISVDYKATNSGGETKHTAKLCSTSCAQLQWIASDKSTRSKKDQYVRLNFQNQQSGAEYQMEYQNNHDQRKTLNKLTVNWNADKYGYVIEINNDRREANFIAQLITPQRKIELNGKCQDLGETRKTTLQFLPYAVRDRSNKFEAEVTYRHTVTRNNRQLSSTIKVSHSEWGQPILAKVDYQWQDSSARPMELKIVLDSGKGNDRKFLIDAQIENNDNNPRNRSLTVSVYDANRGHLDGRINVHLANLIEKMSAGLNWHWLNRQRQMKKGSHIITWKPSQQTFTVSSHAPTHQLNADGKWQANDNRVNVEANVNLDGQSSTARGQIEMQNNLCGEVQWMREPADLLRKYHFCINTESDRMLEISSESWNDNDKSTDASIVFDKRGNQKFKLHLHWNPTKWNNFVYTLMNARKAMHLNSEYINEMMAEMSHKADYVQTTISRHYLNPLKNKLSTEANKFYQEMYEQTRPMMRALRRATENLPDFSEALQPVNKAIDWMSSTASYYTNKVSEKVMKQLTRTLASVCAGNNDCYSLVYAYERHGLQGFSQEVARLSQKYRRDAHQIAYRLKGNVKKMLDSLPSNYKQQVTEAMNSVYNKVSQWRLSQKISEMVTDAIDAWTEIASKATETAFEAAESLANYLKQNEDMRAILSTIQEIVRDIKNELRNVKWNNISNLWGQMMEFLLSPKHWLFDSRFTNYNLEAGDVTLVISAPTGLNTLRSKWVH